MSDNPRLGILLMIATTMVFALQDAFSRHLAETYNVLTVVLFRYWFFAAFVIGRSALRPGGLRAAARTTQPLLQIFRGVLLVAEICVMVLAFTLLGLVQSHAIFAFYPLIIAILSGPVLGEKVGWRRRAAVAVGFVGVLIILRPGLAVFAPGALVALTAAAMFALYGLLTRMAARRDSADTSFFYTGVAGAVAISLVAPFWWAPMQTPLDWFWMGCLCLTGVLGHFLLIKAYEATEASTVQPFAYLQLVFGASIGIFVFGETLEWPVAAGAAVVIGAGLFTLWRERVRGARPRGARAAPGGVAP
ncbi:EamA family transporter [Rhodobacteraceae bacterium 2CG4]|uniref:EamA family transporter n=1 Tax=Halovulum marinum TaxID=2662447 RepID=A0A6L5YWP5_9RHOB|nr:DMT family transporter [Halovulum marinum]MSU88607.1 EamA family transporter [Halovulum marinum]